MLDQNGCTGGCGSSPYGKVTLTDSGAGSTSVMVMVELSFGETFAGTGAGEALEFQRQQELHPQRRNIWLRRRTSPDGSIQFRHVPSIYPLRDLFQAARQGNNPGPLNFTVSSATGLTINNFIANAGGFLFSSDIAGANGNTGMWRQ